MNSKVTLWRAALSGVAAILLGTSAAADLFHVNPPRPSPPGKDELAIGTFTCSQQPGNTQGFSSISFSGTSGIGSPFMGGQFSTSAGTSTPLTCDGLAQQVSADATAGGCAVGPVATVGGDFEPPQVTVHFACNGGHDSVVAAIGAVTRSLALVTLASPLD